MEMVKTEPGAMYAVEDTGSSTPTWILLSSMTVEYSSTYSATGSCDTAKAWLISLQGECDSYWVVCGENSEHNVSDSSILSNNCVEKCSGNIRKACLVNHD